MVEPVYQVTDPSCIFIFFSAIQKLAFDMLKTWDSGDLRIFFAFQFSIRRVSVALYDTPTTAQLWDSGDVRIFYAFQLSIRRVTVALYDTPTTAQLIQDYLFRPGAVLI